MNKLIFLTLFSIFFTLFNNVFAQEDEYRVKSIIFVPNEQNITEIYSPTFIEQSYFPAVINALKDVQSYYASQLDGRTFNIDEQPEIVYFTPPDPNADTPNLDYYFAQTNGNQLLRQDDKILYVVWFIGSGNTTPTGGDKNWNYGDKYVLPYNHAFMNHHYLNLLIRTDFEEQELRSRTVRILAHEVGHGLTLLHPCSYADSDASCPWSIRGPLPPSEESFNSVMGWGDLPDAQFNNSQINNELYRLCINPFIVPYINTDDCPQSTAIPEQEIQNFDLLRIIQDPDIPLEITEDNLTPSDPVLDSVQPDIAYEADQTDITIESDIPSE